MALTVNGEKITDATLRNEVSRLQRMGPQPGALPPGNPEAIKTQAKENLRIDLLLSKQCPRIDPPTDVEAREYYKTNLDDFVQPPQVRVSHIVRKPEQGPAAQVTYDEMVALRGELQSGAEFAELATRASECQQEPGGDLGYFARGQMVEAFETIVFSMTVGEISPVFLTQFGFHIATVTDKREQRQLPFEEVREAIDGRLRQRCRHQAADAYVATLKTAAEILETAEATT